VTETNKDSSKGRLSKLFEILFAIFVHGLFAILAILGLLTLNTMIKAWLAGEMPTVEALIFAFFGLFMTVLGAGFFYLGYIGAPRFLGRLEAEREKHRDRPWLVNRQWRARRVVYSTKYTAWFMWIWCFFWWGILGFLWSVNKDLIIADLQGSWDKAIPTSIPFVAGGIGLLVAFNLTWQRYRYGDAVLLIDTLPGYLGESFRGRVLACVKGRPSEPIGVTLTCGSLTSRQRRTAGRETETEWITDELWSNSLDVHPALPIIDSKGRISLPIDIALPSGLPESGHILDDPQIVWKLKIRPGSVLDQALTSEFEVPVFSRTRDP
jgi:hypothetical protein